MNKCFESSNMLLYADDTKIFKIIKASKTAFNYSMIEAGRGAAARGVTAKPTGCGFDSHSRR